MKYNQLIFPSIGQLPTRVLGGTFKTGPSCDPKARQRAQPQVLVLGPEVKDEKTVNKVRSSRKEEVEVPKWS